LTIFFVIRHEPETFGSRIFANSRFERALLVHERHVFVRDVRLDVGRIEAGRFLGEIYAPQSAQYAENFFASVSAFIYVAHAPRVRRSARRRISRTSPTSTRLVRRTPISPHFRFGCLCESRARLRRVSSRLLERCRVAGPSLRARVPSIRHLELARRFHPRVRLPRVRARLRLTVAVQHALERISARDFGPLHPSPPPPHGRARSSRAVERRTRDDRDDACLGAVSGPSRARRSRVDLGTWSERTRSRRFGEQSSHERSRVQSDGSERSSDRPRRGVGVVYPRSTVVDCNDGLH